MTKITNKATKKIWNLIRNRMRCNEFISYLNRSFSVSCVCVCALLYFRWITISVVWQIVQKIKIKIQTVKFRQKEMVFLLFFSLSLEWRLLSNTFFFLSTCICRLCYVNRIDLRSFICRFVKFINPQQQAKTFGIAVNRFVYSIELNFCHFF